MSDSEEEIVPEDEAGNPALVVKRLREKLATAEQERGEYLEGWQRSRAEFSNLKRDEDARRAQTAERIKASIAEDIVRVLDGFEMGFKADTFQKADPEWQKGIKGLYQQLLQILTDQGVEKIKVTKGDAFDPHIHEAMQEVPVDAAEKDHTIVDIFSSGYTLGQNVIRPAQVSVGTHKG